MQVKIRVRWHELQWTIGTPSSIVSGPHASLASNDENDDVRPPRPPRPPPMQRLLLTYLLTTESGGEAHAKMAWKRSSSTFFVYIPTLNFGCWTAALPRSFFLSSSRPGLRFFLLILRLRKDADSLKPALYISFLLPALQVIYHIRRAALRRSLLTNITKFWREAQPLK